MIPPPRGVIQLFCDSPDHFEWRLNDVHKISVSGIIRRPYYDNVTAETVRERHYLNVLFLEIAPGDRIVCSRVEDGAPVKRYNFVEGNFDHFTTVRLLSCNKQRKLCSCKMR